MPTTAGRIIRQGRKEEKLWVPGMPPVRPCRGNLRNIVVVGDEDLRRTSIGHIKYSDFVVTDIEARHSQVVFANVMVVLGVAGHHSNVVVLQASVGR